MFNISTSYELVHFRDQSSHNTGKLKGKKRLIKILFHIVPTLINVHNFERAMRRRTSNNFPQTHCIGTIPMPKISLSKMTTMGQSTTEKGAASG